MTDESLFGICHLALMITYACYGLFPKTLLFDHLYMVSFFILILQWTYFNSECSLSYYYKKHANPSYIAGQKSTDLADFKDFFPSKAALQLSITTTLILFSISFLVVSRRNHIPLFISIPFVTAVLMYRALIVYFDGENLHENKIFQYAQEIIKIAVFQLFFLYMLYI